ncbi:hypothetical protein H4J51_03390 [Colwellia sp. MB02u-18]|uniref:hypothetical protein n=1 Tax=unclassified Colwellia TaxID=196834 RepID=UPI0015F4A679|nr:MULTISPECIES: hypothetical protein [unclassified Colwellia]MBA6224728.1 hypothetical protein [Colwellia sp. MB3u-45]MBA6266820.1 hypothetical protein [Colwellia sp. MB3u-43]MBA6321415.1 hypothetical protein [Colwellia sp. MB02u-19]MBA6323622.1 hypothetical protein [Colwellia sp. MB02u-18]MBA6332443.1 hypothetical protein [Colwellia sp. MB02u-12]
MYQDKIPQEVIQSLTKSERKVVDKSVFERKNLLPLTFAPSDILNGVCHIARDILNARTNEDVITISKAITWMLYQGDRLLFALLRFDESDRDVYACEGRDLYFLHHYFDLSTLNIEGLSWAEVFAVLALMQCAEVPNEIEEELDNDPLSQSLKQSSNNFILFQQAEIADTIARAEVLADTQINHKKLGSAGGEEKAKRIEPLKVEVINRYLKNYTSYSNKKAGEIIDAELTNERHSLLLLSVAEELNLQFAKWIGAFRNGKWKMPINS